MRFDNNKYSVAASAVGRPVEVYAYADRIIIRQDGRIVTEHPRSFGHGETIYDPWHYVPVLARQPGALRNGAPFKDWVLPAAIERVQSRAAGSSNDPSPGSTANVVLQKDFEATIASAEAWLMIASVKLLSRRLARA